MEDGELGKWGEGQGEVSEDGSSYLQLKLWDKHQREIVTGGHGCDQEESRLDFKHLERRTITNSLLHSWSSV